MLAGVRIGAVSRPPMLLAFVDRAGLEQNRPCPSFDRPKGGPPFFHHQHRHRSCATRRRIRKAHPAFLAANTWQGFRMAGASALRRVPRTKGLGRVFSPVATIFREPSGSGPLQRLCLNGGIGTNFLTVLSDGLAEKRPKPENTCGPRLCSIR
jgi:hypothetical protein